MFICFTGIRAKYRVVASCAWGQGRWGAWDHRRGVGGPPGSSLPSTVILRYTLHHACGWEQGANREGPPAWPKCRRRGHPVRMTSAVRLQHLFFSGARVQMPYTFSCASTLNTIRIFVLTAGGRSGVQNFDGRTITSLFNRLVEARASFSPLCSYVPRRYVRPYVSENKERLCSTYLVCDSNRPI